MTCDDGIIRSLFGKDSSQHTIKKFQTCGAIGSILKVSFRMALSFLFIHSYLRFLNNGGVVTICRIGCFLITMVFWTTET